MFQVKGISWQGDRGRLTMSRVSKVLGGFSLPPRWRFLFFLHWWHIQTLDLACVCWWHKLRVYVCVILNSWRAVPYLCGCTLFMRLYLSLFVIYSAIMWRVNSYTRRRVSPRSTSLPRYLGCWGARLRIDGLGGPSFLWQRSSIGGRGGKTSLGRRFLRLASGVLLEICMRLS